MNYNTCNRICKGDSENSNDPLLELYQYEAKIRAELSRLTVKHKRVRPTVKGAPI
jgi:hypothetical protein